jgi:hypothetical protein
VLGRWALVSIAATVSHWRRPRLRSVTASSDRRVVPLRSETSDAARGAGRVGTLHRSNVPLELSRSAAR